MNTFEEDLMRWNQDPRFRSEFKRATREIHALDTLVNSLDETHSLSATEKANLARFVRSRTPGG